MPLVSFGVFPHPLVWAKAKSTTVNIKKAATQKTDICLSMTGNKESEGDVWNVGLDYPDFYVERNNLRERVRWRRLQELYSMDLKTNFPSSQLHGLPLQFCAQKLKDCTDSFPEYKHDSLIMPGVGELIFI
jgi:hypothetical protein